MGWYLAPCLARLRDEVNSLYPNRSKASDGTIGDPAHGARTSDHNPKADGRGGFVVDAFDLTDDEAHGVLAHEWIRKRCASSDPRIKYAISRRMIWSPGTGWARYTGVNPHDTHVHISVRANGRDNTMPWFPQPPQEDDMTPDQAADLTAVKNYAVDAQARLVDHDNDLQDVKNYLVDIQGRIAAIAAKVGL